MPSITGLFKGRKASKKSEKSAGALVRVVAAPFARSCSQSSEERTPSPSPSILLSSASSSTDSQSSRASSPSPSTSPSTPPTHEAQQSAGTHRPTAPRVEATQLFEGRQKFHSELHNNNTIDGTTAQAWVGSQEFKDAVINTNTNNLNSYNTNTGNDNCVIIDDTTAHCDQGSYGSPPMRSQPSFPATTSAPGASTSTSTPPASASPTQLFDGSQKFRSVMINTNVGGGQAQVFTGDQDFFGPVSNTNIGNSNANHTSNGTASPSTATQPAASTPQDDYWRLRNPNLVPESHRLPAPESWSPSTPAAVPTPVSASTSAAPSSAPAAAAPTQVYEGRQKFHSAMVNNNTGGGSAQVFSGDQEFFGPMTNNNTRNSNSSNVNTGNTNSYTGAAANFNHWAAASAQWGPSAHFAQPGMPALANNPATLNYQKRTITEGTPLESLGFMGGARLQAHHEMASGYRRY